MSGRHRSAGTVRTSRRDFLKRFAMVSTALSAPGFLVRSLRAAQSLGLTGGGFGASGRILVVVELAGGCDGLNTLVPYNNDHYYAARPNLSIPPGSVLRITDEMGFHPGLSGFRDLFEDGSMAIVQGVGYPNPNRSHFRSRDIWYTAEAEEIGSDGWLAKYFDSRQGGGSFQGVNVGGRVPRAMISESGSSPSITSIDTYQIQTDARYPQDDANKNHAFQQIISEPGGRYSFQEYVTQTVLDATFSSAQILEGSESYDSSIEYPDSVFATNLRTIAQVISADLGVTVFYATVPGFDTHANQVVPGDTLAGIHAELLSDVSSGIKAFMEDMQEMGRSEDVLLMTFSEFGRRLNENASSGSDHGTANQMFLFGPRVNAGFFGAQPSLDPGDLDPIGDMVHNVDFRSVYSTVLANWLEVDPVPLIGESWPLLGFV